MIDEFASLIPKSVLATSGRVFYSGRSAFSNSSPLYILGLNPGGSPEDLTNNSVEQHTQEVLDNPNADWSAYSDECWGNSLTKGTWGLQPRVRHLIKGLELNEHRVPSSNVVFVRSTTAQTLDGDFSEMAEAAWPFHQAVIAGLGIRMILCFGKTAGNWVANKLEANRFVDACVECNNRRWRSVAYSNKEGIIVLMATHPSRADWTAPATDPTSFANRMMRSF